MSERLRKRIVAEIRARGPIGFDEYMRFALYDPEDGFFSRAPVGRHFVTSAHVSPLFAILVTRALHEAWDALDRPEVFTVVEIGGGDGALARGVISAAAADPEFESCLAYITVEQDAVARARLIESGLDARPAPPAEAVVGCVLANELLDNFPFRLARERDGRPVEVMVGADNDRLVEVERPTSEDFPPGPPLRPGEERPVSADVERFPHDVAAVLARGYAFAFDYGFVEGEEPESVRGYREHRFVHDLLADPGATDITGPVDFERLSRAARAAGLDVWGPVTQRDALMSLGYRELLDRLRQEQAELEAAGRWCEAIARFGARGDAATLVDPGGLGSLKLITFGTPGCPPPRATAET